MFYCCLVFIVLISVFNSSVSDVAVDDLLDRKKINRFLSNTFLKLRFTTETNIGEMCLE